MFESSPLEDIDPDHYFGSTSDVPDSRSQYFSVNEFRDLMSNSFSGLTVLNYNIRSFNANSSTFLSIFNPRESRDYYINRDLVHV